MFKNQTEVTDTLICDVLTTGRQGWNHSAYVVCPQLQSHPFPGVNPRRKVLCRGSVPHQDPVPVPQWPSQPLQGLDCLPRSPGNQFPSFLCFLCHQGPRDVIRLPTSGASWMAGYRYVGCKQRLAPSYPCLHLHISCENARETLRPAKA